MHTVSPAHYAQFVADASHLVRAACTGPVSAHCELVHGRSMGKTTDKLNGCIITNRTVSAIAIPLGANFFMDPLQAPIHHGRPVVGPRSRFWNRLMSLQRRRRNRIHNNLLAQTFSLYRSVRKPADHLLAGRVGAVHMCKEQEQLRARTTRVLAHTWRSSG